MADLETDNASGMVYGIEKDSENVTNSNATENKIITSNTDAMLETEESTVIDVASDSFSLFEETTIPEIITETERTAESELSTEMETSTEHSHSFSKTTCTEPAKCSCGATNGNAKGHNWKNSTCATAKMCTVCGDTEGSVRGHSFSAGKCSVCGIKDPNNASEAKVWIPTKGGKKYHSHASCSGMEGPIQVTEKEALKRGFGPCGRCY